MYYKSHKFLNDENRLNLNPFSDYFILSNNDKSSYTDNFIRTVNIPRERWVKNHD